ELREPAVVRLPIANQADGLAVAFTDHVGVNDDDIFLERTNSTLGNVTVTPINTSGLNTDHPSITSFSNGEVWVSYTTHNSATDWDILAQRVDANGNTIGGPITLINQNDRSDNSDLATLANGNVVAVFQNELNANPNDNDIFYTIKTQAGTNVVSPTFV